MHLFGRPCRIEELPDLPVIEDAAGALGARRGGRACGSLGLAALPQLPPAQDRHDRRGRRDHDRRRPARRGASRCSATTAGARSPTRDMPRAGPQLPALGHPLRRRAAAAPAPRRAARRRARGSPPPTPSGSADLPVTLPVADEGDVHGWQAYVIQVDRRDEVLDGAPRAGDRGPDRHVRAAAPPRLPRPGILPGRGARLRARAGTAVPHAPDGVRAGSGRGSAGGAPGLTYL